MKVVFLEDPLGRGAINRHDDQPVGPSARTVDRDPFQGTTSSTLLLVIFYIPPETFGQRCGRKLQ